MYIPTYTCVCIYVGVCVMHVYVYIYICYTDSEEFRIKPIEALVYETYKRKMGLDTYVLCSLLHFYSTHHRQLSPASSSWPLRWQLCSRVQFYLGLGLNQGLCFSLASTLPTGLYSHILS